MQLLAQRGEHAFLERTELGLLGLPVSTHFRAVCVRVHGLSLRGPWSARTLLQSEDVSFWPSLLKFVRIHFKVKLKFDLSRFVCYVY